MRSQGTSRRWLSVPALAALVLLAPARGAVAQAVNLTDPALKSPRGAIDPNRFYRVALAPRVPLPLGQASRTQLRRLRLDFPGWIFQLGAAAPAPGRFDIPYYDADVDADLPHDFEVDYVPGVAFPPPGTVLQWIQFISTNDPVAPGLPTPYVDPQPNDDALPFYWTEAERLGNTGLPGGIALRFTDRPARPLADAPVTWRADLFLVSWNQVAAPGGAAPPTVTIYGGVHWGFDIRAGCPAQGNNVDGGVAGDKYDRTGTGSSAGPPVCPLTTPEPSTLSLTGIAGLALLLTTAAARRSRLGPRTAAA